MVARGDEVGDVRVEREAGGLLQEADDHVRRRPHRVEDIAGVDHQVHLPLQDGVNRPPVSLLNIHLPLVAACLGAKLRVPRVPQVRIRDVRYTNDALRNPRRSSSGSLPRILYPDRRALPVDHAETLAHQRHVRCRFLVYVRQRAREEAPVGLPLVLQRTIPPLLLRRRTGRRPRHTVAPLPRSSRRCTWDRRPRPVRWSSTRSRVRVPLRLRTPKEPSRPPFWFQTRSAHRAPLPSRRSRPILPLRIAQRVPANPAGASPGSFASMLEYGHRPLPAPKWWLVCETPTRVNPSSCRARRVCARRRHRCGGFGWAS